jgi:ATP-binding cassette, subfamily B, bacterial MsbA
LLPRFYDPSAGTILLDGHDLREFTLKNVREQMAMVSQDVMLFNDTIRNNIAYGSLGKHTEADIVAAAEAAYAMPFIQRLPQGLDTVVGDRGVMLSGGERQRISIARALLKNAPVLILDEATSALDSESERHIQAALEALMVDRTTLVIAHRLSTVERADRIIVMDRGNIVEMGKHAELIAKGGQYAALHRLQFRDSDD